MLQHLLDVYNPAATPNADDFRTAAAVMQAYFERHRQIDVDVSAFRALFGDERADYGQALQNHYLNGAPPDWSSRHVTAYASCHPWEDWAETWAHYLHMRDTLGTARGFGIRGDRVELACEKAAPNGMGPQVLVLTDAVAQSTVDLAVHALAAHPAVAGPVAALRVEMLEG